MSRLIFNASPVFSLYTLNYIITNTRTYGYSTLAGAGAGAGACSELALVPLVAAGGCGPLRRPFSLANMSPNLQVHLSLP